jgi:transposase
MATHGAARRDFPALELRRQHAARLFADGRKTQGAIARLLDVSRQSVMRWYHAWRAGGRAGLKAAGRAGRKPRLEPRQLAAVETALRRGPLAAGFTTNLWTLPRVAVLIERVTGIRYHPGHVWRILGRLDWTLQRPAKRAKERNEAAIQHWVDVRWPAVKKTLAAGAPGSSSRTKAASRNAPRSGARGRRAATPPS